MSGCCSCDNSLLKHLIIQLVSFVAIVLPLFLSVWRASELTTLALDPIIIYMILAFATVMVYIPLQRMINCGFFHWTLDNTGW